MPGLYTSQVHLKRLLAGQATPAFTPVDAVARQLINPAFVPGMGALNEDDKGRLQCPVCGEWHLYLGNHLHHAHRTVGGIKAVRVALDIPSKTALLSKRASDHRREFSAAYGARGRATLAASGFVPKFSEAADRARLDAEARRGSTYSSSQRNYTDTCPAQLHARIIALRDKIGRSPTFNEFQSAYGGGLAKAVTSLFGTWNNAKALAGLSVYENGAAPADLQTKRLTVALVCESLRAWYDEHGDLPPSHVAHSTARTPYIPSIQAIQRAFGVNNWRAAMRSAIEHLGVKSERYGSPSTR